MPNQIIKLYLLIDTTLLSP